MSWRALLAMVQHSPQGSALFRQRYGDEALWGTTEQLLAALVDVQRLALWLKTKDGADGRNQPRPLPRPGQAPDSDSEHLGSDAIPVDDWDAWWNAEAPRDSD